MNHREKESRAIPYTLGKRVEPFFPFDLHVQCQYRMRRLDYQRP
jgi:hypothetical protein